MVIAFCFLNQLLLVHVPHKLYHLALSPATEGEDTESDDVGDDLVVGVERKGLPAQGELLAQSTPLDLRRKSWYKCIFRILYKGSNRKRHDCKN